MMPNIPVLPALPVRDVLTGINDALALNRPVVLQAPPGSGKTTLVPLALMQAPWLGSKTVLMLEPRRLAARAAARRIASLLSEEVGQRVGYHVRFERQIGPQTRIEILTEGLLVQRLQHDQELSGCGVVIFDEFHERNLASDQAFAMVLDLQRSIRPDLRIVVMSATLDTAPVARHIGNTVAVTATVKNWPIETFYITPSLSRKLEQETTAAVQKALREHNGNILVFLPGEAEIRRTTNLLRDASLPPDVSVHPLYSALSRQLQDAAIAPPAPYCRKIVLATSIAESSLTIEGISIVIDTGWMRVPRYSPRTGMSRLETLRITRDRADQRRGRCGRTGPGICYRLWSEATDQQLRQTASPEIMDTDLAPLALQSIAWDSRSYTNLPWFTPPPDAAWQQATALLALLNAIDRNGNITPYGKLMAKLPIHPRLSYMILRARESGAARQACLLAAAISELATSSQIRHITDAETILDLVLARSGKHVSAENIEDQTDTTFPNSWVNQAYRLAQQWMRSLQLPSCDHTSIAAGRMLSWGFPERVARRRDAHGRYLMVNGKGAVLDPADPLAREDWLVAVESRDDAVDARIRLAAALDSSAIDCDFANQIVEESEVFWDRQSMVIKALKRRKLGAIILQTTPITRPESHHLRNILLDEIKRQGIENLNWSASALSLQARIQLLHARLDQNFWPDVSPVTLNRIADDFLGSALDGLYRWDQVMEIDLNTCLYNLIGNKRRLLEELAPSYISLPKGNRVKIHYELNAEPYFSARIQQLFGMQHTPPIAGGRIPLSVHLLSPAQRPVQITADLAGFWRGSYQLVRKDLRGRYPKHAWPEDPANPQ